MPARTGRSIFVSLGALAVLAGGCGGAGGPSTVTADGFVARFSWHATRSSTSEGLQHQRVSITTWVASHGDETDAVSSSTPDGVGAGGPAARLAEAVTGSTEALGGSLISHRDIRWLGHVAETAVIATTDRLVRERVVIAGGRLDVLEGISRAVHPSFVGYDHLVATFSLADPRG